MAVLRRGQLGLALPAGMIGSFVGGMLVSLIAGDGLELRASGLVGSLVGAVIVTLAWRWWQVRKAPRLRGAGRAQDARADGRSHTSEDRQSARAYEAYGSDELADT